jgi:hypothetical protein
MMAETVNPANGSLSLRIQTPTPKGRGITVPFTFTYDTTAVRHLVADPSVGWSQDTPLLSPYLTKGDWSYDVFMLSYTGGTTVTGSGNEVSSCGYETNFMFQDPGGGRHALGLAASQPVNMSSCLFPGESVPNAGDDLYRASLQGTYPGPVTQGR